jgi:HTH-type transcriptional regulator/antitoxin HigA
MITNEKQYKTTKALVEKLRKAKEQLSVPTGAPSALLEAQIAALASQLEELESDVALYEGLKAGKKTKFQADSLRELPDILIQARIARGMSQKDFADFLGMKEQQVQRYEAERYRSASLDRLIEFADALDVDLKGVGHLVGDGKLGKIDTEQASAFPIAEMYKRGWFEDFSGSLAEAKKSADVLLSTFFKPVVSHWAPAALHRKSVRTSAKVHEAAIAAWEARILSVAEKVPTRAEFNKDLVTDRWLEALVQLSADPRGPRVAVDFLSNVGIVLVIEPHLPGTLLDGAAMRTADNITAIGMTLRHDRLDNFWFTLLHEIGHLVLHIGAGKFASIFDDTESPAETEFEKEADYFAQEALLSTKNWHASLSRFSRTEKSVLADARKFGIGPSIIAGRIRREAGDYTILKTLVGAGEPRRQLGS